MNAAHLIPITSTQRIAYAFLAHLVILLIGAACAAGIDGLARLDADAIRRNALDPRPAAFAQVTLTLALMSGMIGGGLYALSHERGDSHFADARLLVSARRLWTITCAALPLVVWIEPGISPLLDVLPALTVIAVGIVVVRGVPRWWGLPRLWLAGLCALAAGCLLAETPFGGVLRDGLGIGLGVVALAFWQMHRFSDLPMGWVNTGLYSVGGLWTVGAVWLGLPPLYRLIPFTGQVGAAGVVILPVVCAILASHAHLALTHRNTMRTLSAYWVGLYVILILIGMGLLGAVNALPDAARYTATTRLAGLQTELIRWAFAAVLLGAVNQIAAELRRENRRITGLAPFWLVGFGVLLVAIGEGCAGVVETYLRWLMGMSAPQAAALVIPLMTLAAIGRIGMLLGLVGYGAGFWVRRVR
ncbi:MAG: hypothetical protein SF162_08900 [bacterium]|nr:hypothetical protein [bacterium]